MQCLEVSEDVEHVGADTKNVLICCSKENYFIVVFIAYPMVACITRQAYLAAKIEL